jgi:opacity protein-like surface antigen
MKTILIAALAAALLAGTAHAADPSPAQKAQQMRMTQCNKDAEGKTGEERKAFMSQCLSAKKETQQDKMKTCNAQAEGKKGDERKAFMKDCLSAKPAG